MPWLRSRMLGKALKSQSTGVYFGIKRFMSGYKITRIQRLKGPVNVTSDVSFENQEESLKNAVMPLWNVPYPEQLKMKEDHIAYVVSRYFSILEEDQAKTHPSKKISRFSKPTVNKIIPSPVLFKYRTVDNYMVRTGVDGNPKTVGHIVGNTSTGKYVCVPPLDIVSPTSHVLVAKAFQDYIRSSALPACLNYSEGGNWTELVVRSNAQGDIMMLVKIHPQQLTQAEIEDECGKLKEYFENGPGSECHVSSLYFQASPFSNASGKIAPYQLLLGQTHLLENLSGCKFALSPGSFFQRNREVAELMYDKIFRISKLTPATSVLDLCCGIGTISLLATPFVRGTVGIDKSEEAIKDAKYNALLNNNLSSHFISGSIEQRIKKGLELLQLSSNIIAILNPGRCGVEVSAINALREMPQVQTVIYVACEPEHEWVIRNILALIKPKGRKYLGMPFTLVSVTPLDMFPHTLHTEVLMKFNR